MKSLYEGILGDIEDTIEKSDKSVELLNMQLPDFEDYKMARSKTSSVTVLYIWKLPHKVLSDVESLRDELFKPYSWMSPYEKESDNIVIGVSTKKIYIKLAVDRTIVGFPLLSIKKDEFYDKSLFPRTKEDCKQKAYDLLLKLADIDNLKFILTHCGSGDINKNNANLKKIIEKIF